MIKNLTVFALIEILACLADIHWKSQP